MYYNLEKTADTLSLSTGDVNRLREQGKLRAFRDGANWKFRKEDVDKYLAAMIKERSASRLDDDLLSDGSEADDVTLAAGSGSDVDFDAMFDQAADAIVMPNDLDAFAPAAPADDNIQINTDADDEVLAPAEEALNIDIDEPLAEADAAPVLDVVSEAVDSVEDKASDLISGVAEAAEDKVSDLVSGISGVAESVSSDNEDESLADDLVLIKEPEPVEVAASSAPVDDAVAEDASLLPNTEGSEPVASAEDGFALPDESQVGSVDDLIASPEEAQPAVAEPAANADDAVFDLAEEPAANVDDEPVATASDDDFQIVTDEPSAEAAANDDIQVSSDLSLATDNDDFDLAPASGESGESGALPVDDDLVLAPSSGVSGLQADEVSSSLTGEDSALADDLVLSPEENASSVDLAGEAEAGSGSGSGLSLGSDSGLALIDGSGIDLADDGDLVLGGSGSGSGSGSGLNLGGDSGLSLLGDSDAGFDLAAPAQPAASSAQSDDDDDIFALAEEPKADANILNIDQGGDADAATVLSGDQNDDSVFDLASDDTSGPSDSESASGPLFAGNESEDESDDNPFYTSEDEQSDDADDQDLLWDDNTQAAGSESQDSESQTIDITDGGDDLFTPASGESNLFDSDSSGSLSLAGSESATDAFGFSSDSAATDGFSAFGSDSGASLPISEADPGDISAARPAPIASTNFTGKDLFFLVPCLIMLILATLGAIELCRTIWSYQEGTADLGGPILETIAKMVKLM